MKLRMLLCGFLFPLTFFGCQEKETVKPVLELDKTAISVGAESDFSEFSVSSNVDWTLFCSEDWVGLSPKTGKGSSDPVLVTVTVKANKNSDKRVAAVEIRAADLLKTLTVRQEGFTATEIVPEISVSPSRMDLPNESGTVEISLESNVAWNAIVSDDWISVNPRSGSGSEHSTKVIVNYDSNESEAARSATIRFTAGAEVVELKINQSGKNAGDVPFLSISPTKMEVASEESLVSVDVASNVEWFSNTEVEWLSLDKQSGIGNEKVEIAVEANASEHNRSAVICFEIENAKEYLTIIQSGFQPVLDVSRETVELSYKSETVVIEVSSNTDWNASVGVDWIALTPTSGDGGVAPSTVNITIAANDSESSRSAVVSFAAGSVTAKLKIYQSGRPKPGAGNGSDAGIDDWIKDDDELTAN